LSKVIFWIVVVFVVLFAVRLLNAAKARRRAEPPPTAARDKEVAASMVQCAECGVYLPKADARLLPQGFGCGDPRCAHRDKQR
jgi:uncharacterized protein